MKDAFRFQNKLQTLMGTAQDILSSSRNITKVENTYLRKKVMPEAEDEVTVDQPTSEYSEQITCVAEFLLYLPQTVQSTPIPTMPPTTSPRLRSPGSRAPRPITRRETSPAPS